MKICYWNTALFPVYFLLCYPGGSKKNYKQYLHSLVEISLAYFSKHFHRSSYFLNTGQIFVVHLRAMKLGYFHQKNPFILIIFRPFYIWASRSRTGKTSNICPFIFGMAGLPWTEKQADTGFKVSLGHKWTGHLINKCFGPKNWNKNRPKTPIDSH